MKRENEMSQFEAMVMKLVQVDEWDRARERERSLTEDEQVALDLVGGLTWQEHEPLGRRLGMAEGMANYLRGRPEPRDAWLAKQERELLEALERLMAWGEEIESRDDPESFAEELALAQERCLFEDTMFAATEEFFALLAVLDEPWPL
ncbi:MAG TPA: hypothetical protein VMB50_16720 [Myxococcales bacterium]|nr:hypothetical protein [Myxococcales bacterium]